MKISAAILLLLAMTSWAAPPNLDDAAIKPEHRQAWLQGYLALSLKQKLESGDVEGALEELQLTIDAASEKLGYDIESEPGQKPTESLAK